MLGGSASYFEERNWNLNKSCWIKKQLYLLLYSSCKLPVPIFKLETIKTIMLMFSLPLFLFHFEFFYLYCSIPLAWTCISNTFPLSLGQAQTCIPMYLCFLTRSVWILLYFLIITIFFSFGKVLLMEPKQALPVIELIKPFQIKQFLESSPLLQLQLPPKISKYLVIIS